MEDKTFVKGYRFLYFAKNMGKKIGKKKSKNVSGKYGQKRLDHSKQSATDAIKTSKGAIQKTAEATGYLIGNKITNTIIKVSKNSQQNNSETVANEHDKEIPKEKNMYLQKKGKKLLIN